MSTTTAPQKIALRDAFGAGLVELGKTNEQLVALDADVSSSCKTAAFGAAYPDRFFNCGVGEANMVDIAAGLALGGQRPVCSTFALFLVLKGAEQIRNTVCYNKLPVIIAGGYGGLSDSYDGASHQSLTDIAVMRSLPNMTVVVPGDANGVQHALEQGLEMDGPLYLRLSRNPTPVYSNTCSEPLTIGKIRRLRSGSDITIAVCGVVTNQTLEAVDILDQQGVSAELLEVHTLKPFDTETLIASVAKTGRILTVEEHNVIGGLAGAVAECTAQHHPVPMKTIGVQDCFTESGDYDELLDKYGLSTQNIVAKAKELLS